MNYEDIDTFSGAVVSIPNPDAPWEDILIPNPLQTSYSTIGSFDDYLRGHFSDDIETTLKYGLYEKRIPVGKPYARICDPDTVLANNVEMVRRSFSHIDRNTIGISSLYRSNITVSEEFGDETYSEQVQQWYEVFGSANFEDDTPTIILADRIDIYERSEFPKEFSVAGLPLSEYLVPIIKKEDLDNVAHHLMETYCPEVLKNPTQINVKKLAKKLGLTIECVKLTTDQSLLGKFVFQEDTITVYDQNNAPRQKKVKANTILIDHDANCSRNCNKIRWTILHEIIHFLLHYHFFQLQHMYNEELRWFSCETNPEYTDKSPIYWIEWQANQLVPRMLMPVETTLQKVEELKKKYSAWHIGRMELLERIIKDLAVFFDVSQQCAKIRLVELGYPEAQGVLNYANGKRIPPYDGSNQEANQTYSISSSDAAAEFERNPEFQKVISSGRFIYVESHFCLNDPKYIRFREGSRTNTTGVPVLIPELTSYARNHIAECCLAFRILSSSDASDYSYVEGSLMREQPITAHVIQFDGSKVGKTGEPGAEVIIQADAPSEFSTRIFDIMKGLPGSFGDTLTAHMNRLEMTKEDLEQYSGVSVATIKRYRNDPETNVQLPSVVALCIGLHLEPALSLDLITKAGFSFRANRVHMMYQLLITSMYMMDINFCNEMLVSNGLKALNSAA